MSTPKSSLLKVSDVMLLPERFPVIEESVIFKTVLEEMGGG